MNQLEESGEEIYTEFNGGACDTDRAGDGGVAKDDDDDDEGLYDLPYDSKSTTSGGDGGHVVGKLQRQLKIKKEESVENLVSPDNDVDEDDDDKNIYQNSLKLLDEIEYIDTAQFMRKIQSRPDTSTGQIMVEPKSPMPMPRREMTSPVDNIASTADLFNNGGAGNSDSLKRRSLDKKDISSPMLLGNHHFMKDRKVIPVKPQVASPRPKSKHDPLLPPALPTKPSGTHLKQFSLDNNNPNNNLTTELKTKVKAVKAVPSLTGAQSSSTLDGRSRYENNIILK